jgi:methionyl-tRNA formyltransferase
MKHYIVATQHPWNVQVFHERISKLPGDWNLVVYPEPLDGALGGKAPEAIFFPHWPLKVSNEIVTEYECIAFHATDLPYGRGGSPIQNLIARGHRATMVSAFRMTDAIDQGPVYLKRPLSLDGTAEEIYLRLAGVVADMIQIIIESKPVPRPQGETTAAEATDSGGPIEPFKRRQPEQSRIPDDLAGLGDLFDHLRMLDAQGYPPAFAEIGGFRVEFRNPVRRTDAVEAIVRITRN